MDLTFFVEMLKLAVLYTTHNYCVDLWFFNKNNLI